jgi:molybdopterin converting factor subunit 1
VKIEILLFAALREIAGADHLTTEVSVGTTYCELRELIAAERPQLAKLLEVSRFAAGSAMVADDDIVDATKTIALIPPVSGG